MEKTSDLWFYNHCNEPHCTMGSVEFYCPACNRLNVEYGNLWYWWLEGEFIEKDEVAKCEHCGIDLIAKYDEDRIPCCSITIKQ